MENLPSDSILHQAITEINEPVLFKKILQDLKDEYSWKLFDWSLLEFAEKVGDTKLPFRIGYNARSTSPQWEENCSVISMTLSEFIKNVSVNENDTKWYYFDYKYMQEWFKNKPDIINSITWKMFGIDKDGTDSTLWIGNKGAHTNCHQDSYGSNLVAQIHGRKQWLLFPPDSTRYLQPTRIPYEESTVYSKYNFFCPTEDNEINILKIQERPKLVTLEPGDVLFVPPGWWHYVESLDLTVSVNVWLPVETDHMSRVKEAIVKLVIAGIGKSVCNMTNEAECSLSDCTNLLNIALEQYKNMEAVESPCKKMKHTAWTATDLAAQYPIYVKLLHELEATELEQFLKTNRRRFSESSVELLKDQDVQNIFPRTQQLSKDIVNALCHPDVVNKVTELLLS
ncbi:HSPB1 associated protein 1 [Megachile rotundata]|uniref:HSPB1 associated protein 1 n=1 Tax=Megachile rotundata TaxID=143995 RepID=UPI000258ED24|nr:PREDICTED: HSPB1-associated protein 1 [Megachile rotundata]